MTKCARMHCSRLCYGARHALQRGFTMVELMISMVIGLIVTLLAITLFVATKSTYVAVDDTVELQESGRYALEVIGRAVRQAAYAPWEEATSQSDGMATLSPSIAGLDAKSLKSASAGLESPNAAAVNGSDVLAVRFYGAGDGEHGDASILNCAGFGVPGTSGDEAETGRGWSIFYVANDSIGEPELRCKYKGKSSWNSVALVRGVESFQALYGIDDDADDLPNRYLTASEIDDLDQGLVLVGETPAAKARDRNRKTHWKKVVAVKVALLIRGTQSSRVDELAKRYDLFGPQYASAAATNDAGVTVNEADLPPKVRNRIRKVFAATVYFPNPQAGSAS